MEFMNTWSWVLYIEIFCINEDIPIEPVFEAVNAEVDSPGELQEYGALNMKKKIDAEGLENVVGYKKMNEKSTVCFWLVVVTSFIILKW